MKTIMNLKKSLLAIATIIATIAFSACATGGEEFDYPEDNPASTGLCGVKWVLKSVSGGETTNYSAYYFELNGTGYSEEKATEEDELTRKLFTWKSYNIGSSSMHMLTIRLEGSKYDLSTYYNVTGETLRLNDTQGGIYTYVPEDQTNNE